tara:strand:+ start:19054 stop:19485 length:432 start_codon:yes stop_codon:yes gene_type:complete
MSVDLLWTLLIQGGAEVSFRAQGTIQYHDGSQSIWKVRGNEEAIQEVVATAQSVGCQVTVYGEGQTNEQEKIRLKMLGAQKEGYVFQTEQCPNCHWFDPLTETNCGFEDWPDETVDASVLLHEKARLDRDKCPLNLLPIEHLK